MFILILIVLLVIILFYFIKNKIYIDVKSIFSRTLPLKMGVFGVYCFTGKQGSGKTYSVVKYISKHSKGNNIYSNVTLKGINYIHLETIRDLLDLKDYKGCVIVYDEIFTLLTKQTKLSSEITEFLSQQRKQSNIFITTAQEWLNLPIEFRRFVRVQVECTTRPLGKFGGILKEIYFDAYNMKWSQLDNEYIAPLISTKYSKYEKKHMLSYDTFERICKLN